MQRFRTRTLRVARREHNRGCCVSHQGLDEERAAAIWARNAHRRLDLNNLRPAGRERCAVDGSKRSGAAWHAP